jgi:deazaflavin-dependent oxidoreductase (nitroreductase family)
VDILRNYLYLTTIGRKSGEPREIEIWFTARGGKYYLIAERREEAHWVQNIQHNPHIAFRLGPQRFTGMGRIVDGAHEPELWREVRDLSEKKYGWSDGLVVELIPDEETT